ERVPETDDDLERAGGLLPEREGDARARVLPAPRLAAGERLHELLGFRLERGDVVALEPAGGELWRRVPAAAESGQQALVQLDEPEVLAEAGRVVGLRRHQVALRPEMEAAVREEKRDHRRPGAVHAEDGDGHQAGARNAKTRQASSARATREHCSCRWSRKLS